LDRRDLASCLFLIAVAVFVCIHAIHLHVGTFFAPGPGFVLFLSSLALGALSILFIITHSLKKGPKTKILDLWRGLDWKNVALAVMALLLYPVFLPIAGFLLTSFGSLLILFGLGRMKPWLTVTCALVTTILSYIIFKGLLGVPFP